MKKVLLIAGLLFTGLMSAQELESKVIEIAKANDTYYEPGTTRLVKEVSIEQSENNFYKDIDSDKIALKEALAETTKIADQAKKENDADTYQVWSFKKERLEKFAKANKNDVDYKVLEHKYTSRNPQNSYKVNKVTSYFFFDGNNNYLGNVDSKTYDECTVKFDKSETQRYEAMLFEIKH